MSVRMRFPYHLASPLMKGEDVERVQRALNSNKYGDFLKDTTVDGEFGPASAQSTARAKYWLGYPKNKVNKSFGETLWKYLQGTKSLSPAMRLRRKARIRARNQIPQRKKALKLAISQIGVKESPFGSNRTKYGEWYGFNGVAWCAIFVSWCYYKVGNRTTFAPNSARGNPYYAFVPFMESDAKAHRNRLRVVSHPEPGDLVLFQFDTDAFPDHIGIFEMWRGGGNFTSIEGNTSLTSQANGGMVMRRQRHTSQVKCFVRVVTG